MLMWLPVLGASGAGYEQSIQATYNVDEAHRVVQALFNAKGVGEVAMGASSSGLLRELALAHAKSGLWKGKLRNKDVCKRANTNINSSNIDRECNERSSSCEDVVNVSYFAVFLFCVMFPQKAINW